MTAIGNIKLQQNKMEETKVRLINFLQCTYHHNLVPKISDTAVNMWLFFKALIEQARGMLETIDGVTTVHGRFYELCSNYHKVSEMS